VLKAPSHVFSFDALLDTYPDAWTVQTHRDPVTAVASVASLSSVLHRAFGRQRPASRFGHEVANRWTEGLERSLELRRSGRASPARVVDVHHHEFVADPMSVVRRIYSQFDLPLSASVDARMRAFLAGHPRNAQGRHEYASEPFGLDREDLARRFRAYSEHFGVRPEMPLRG
jgi:hypothetical protein